MILYILSAVSVLFIRVVITAVLVMRSNLQILVDLFSRMMTELTLSYRT